MSDTLSYRHNDDPFNNQFDQDTSDLSPTKYIPVQKTVELPMVRLKLATPGLQIQCSSHSTLQLKSYCWEGTEFIQLVYCIIVYLSFLSCD